MVGIFTLAGVYGAAMLVLGGGVGRAILWEVPAGFHGWAFVRNGVSTCAPLETRRFYIIASTLPSGEGCTSSPAWVSRWRYCRLEIVRPDGTRSVGTLSKGRFFDRDSNRHFLFVGTDEELHREGGPRI